MSASYIHRDPLVLNPSALQLLSTRAGGTAQNDYPSLPTDRPYQDRTISIKSSPSNYSQVSLQSPKMSPDSTLTNLPHQSVTSVPTFGSGSPSGLCASGGASSMRESFLRSALVSDCIDKQQHCVGSSTGISNLIHAKSESGTPVSPIMRPRALTVSRAGTPNSSISTTPNSSNSTPTPSSTTPVKKSSRRNPWGSETYSDLISVAIHSYPDQQATLQQIYDFIITHYDYFRERSDPTSSAGWKNSIRHNLSLHDRFTKCPKSSDNTKSSYWRINTEVASKPYVRRRACSMDTNNLKKPGGNTCGKSSNRVGSGAGGTHRTSIAGVNNQVPSSAKMLTSPARGGPVSIPSTLPSLCEMQCASSGRNADLNSLISDTTDCMARPDDSKLFSNRPLTHDYSKGDLSTNSSKLSGYFFYPPSNGSGLDQDASMGSFNGNRWSSSRHPLGYRPSYPSSFTPYHYDQNVGSLFDSSEFPVVGSSTTDQALFRYRASGLIEQLLRSDNANGINRGNNGGRHPSPAHASNPYLPNSFATGRSVLPTSNHNNSTSNISRGPMQIDTNLDSPPSTAQSSSIHLSTLNPSPLEGTADNMQSHHLRPVLIQNSGSGDLPSAFGPVSWSGYTNEFHGINSSYPSFGNSFVPPAANSLSSAATTKVKYDPSDPNGTRGLLSFLAPTTLGPLSASVGNNCSGSSAKSWCRPLGLDLPMSTEHQRSSMQSDRLTPLSTSPRSVQTNSGVDNRILGPVTPPNPLYYSPVRQTVSGLFTSATEGALDTPPYHQIKQEQLGETDSSGTNSSATADGSDPNAASCSTTTVYDLSDQINNAHTSSSSSYTISSHLGHPSSENTNPSSLDAHYNDSFSYDDDSETLELELSLELADRIVGSTRTTGGIEKQEAQHQP
ncbi:unnamed protein product [Calicophoron daubneyi]|uniref:Fork-head domain-containing protein n=1 Tax=Calicophoron daubneyi TaxID=300641 RepID=A0AAV2T244_CALDB